MSDCTCSSCVAACKTTPGWFAPGEAEKAADLLGMTFADFKRTYLIREWWVGDKWTGGVDVHVLAPRRVGVDDGRDTASFSAAFSHAPCVFLENDRCKIHAAKPKECREAMCCVVNKTMDRAAIRCKKEIVQAWQTTEAKP